MLIIYLTNTIKLLFSYNILSIKIPTPTCIKYKEVNKQLNTIIFALRDCTNENEKKLLLECLELV